MNDSPLDNHREVLAAKHLARTLQDAVAREGISASDIIQQLLHNIAAGPVEVLPTDEAALVARTTLEIAAESTLRDIRDQSVAAAQADGAMMVFDPIAVSEGVSMLLLAATIEFDVTIGTFRLSKKPLSAANIGKLIDAMKAILSAPAKGGA